MKNQKEFVSQVVSILKEKIRRELENIVLDTMNHPAEVPEDMIDYIKAAREQGFSGILEGFDEILREVGKMQVEKVSQRMRSLEIQEAEKALQQYFTADNGRKLEGIEQGLVYKFKEKPTRAGRLDIVARDREDREVKIELKARDYDSKRVFFQIMKYYNDDKTGNARVIFIAPEVKPDLVFSLAQYERAGRMAFFQVEKSNGDYALTKVTPESIENPREIDWSRKPRKKPAGLMKVTSKLKGEGGIREKESEIAEEEWDKLPTYEKLRRTYFPDMKLERRDISERDYNRLTERVIDPAKIDEFSIFERVLPEIRTSPFLMTEKEKRAFNIIARTTEDDMSLLIDYLHDFGVCLRKARDEKNLETTIDSLGRLCTIVKLTTREFLPSNRSSSFNKMLAQRLRLKTEGIAPNKEFVVDNILKIREAIYHDFVNLSKSIALKALRADLLSQYSEDLARIYLFFSPYNFYGLFGLKPFEGRTQFPIEERYIKPADFHNFVAADNHLYKTLLTFLNPVPDLKTSLEQKAREKINDTTPAPQPAPKIPFKEQRETKYTTGSVVPSKFFMRMPEDTQLRVRYFVEEVLNNPGYSPEQRDRLAKKALKSKWYKKEDLSEMNVRNFFDGLTLVAIREQKKQ